MRAGCDGDRSRDHTYSGRDPHRDTDGLGAGSGHGKEVFSFYNVNTTPISYLLCNKMLWNLAAEESVLNPSTAPLT